MAKTVASGASPYCTGEECVQFVDVALLGDLLEDGDAFVEAGDVPAHPNLTAQLKAASGEVEAACLKGGRYTSADLAALAAGTTNSAWMLKKLVARLAALDLLQRRRPDMDVPKTLERAAEMLDSLGDGDTIFAFEETVDAGGGAKSTPLYDTEEDAERSPVRQARRFFGDRQLRGY